RKPVKFKRFPGIRKLRSLPRNQFAGSSGSTHLPGLDKLSIEFVNQSRIVATTLTFLVSTSLHAIMAGGEFDSPEDRPSFRVDPLSTTSPYNFVGGLSIDTGASTYYGTGVALSSNWVLTAGHNVDFDDNGTADSDLSIEINLPGFGSYSVDSYQPHPNFTGFGNPTVQNDLSLLYFSSPLPDLAFPALGLNMGGGDTLTLAGFGRSGYGSYGYTTSAGFIRHP
ncbi:MAG: trypsin-like serine protease, partial [Opitutales bacterium]